MSWPAGVERYASIASFPCGERGNSASSLPLGGDEVCRDHALYAVQCAHGILRV